MGVLQAGVVLWAKAVGSGAFPAAEREAYHAALVALAGEDAGRDPAAWRAYAARAAPAPTTLGR